MPLRSIGSRTTLDALITDRRVLLAVLVDVLLLLAFLGLAMGRGSPAEPAQPGADVLSSVDSAAPPQAPVVRTPAYGLLKAEIEGLLATQPVEVGVALLGVDGQLLVGHNVDRPFVLASVAKLYILAAYLDQVRAEGRRLDDTDIAQLQAMIRYSDNNSASDLWDEIGEEEGLAAFLASKGMQPVTTTEQGAWGTLNASPAHVAELLRRLASGELLDPESTQIAMSFLADVEEDQAWGVSAEAESIGARVYLKNGWYPEDEGWRVNSAGLVEQTGQRYALVVMVYPASGMDEGVGLIEEIAGTVNAFMAGARPGPTGSQLP